MIEDPDVGTGTARVDWFEVTRDGVAVPSIFRLIDHVPHAGDDDYATGAP